MEKSQKQKPDWWSHPGKKPKSEKTRGISDVLGFQIFPRERPALLESAEAILGEIPGREASSVAPKPIHEAEAWPFRPYPGFKAKITEKAKKQRGRWVTMGWWGLNWGKK